MKLTYTHLNHKSIADELYNIMIVNETFLQDCDKITKVKVQAYAINSKWEWGDICQVFFSRSNSEGFPCVTALSREIDEYAQGFVLPKLADPIGAIFQISILGKAPNEEVTVLDRLDLSVVTYLKLLTK